MLVARALFYPGEDHTTIKLEFEYKIRKKMAWLPSVGGRGW